MTAAQWTIVRATLCLAPALLAVGCLRPRLLAGPEENLRRDLEAASSAAAPRSPARPSPGSLWNESATTALVADTRATRAGDLLTIRIVETTKGSQEATTDLTKDAKLSLKAPVLAGYENRLTAKWPNFNPAQVLDTSTEKAFKGDGATSRETSVVATVTARVLGVYPNGDLAVIGHKDVEVNHERQVLTIVGIARAADIAPDNTVSSDKLAELAMHLGGRGDINDTQREGWLSRLIQKVWPF